MARNDVPENVSSRLPDRNAGAKRFAAWLETIAARGGDLGDWHYGNLNKAARMDFLDRAREPGSNRAGDEPAAAMRAAIPRPAAPRRSLMEGLTSRLPAGAQAVVRPVATGFGTAGSMILKAADFPNRFIGGSRSRLQDLYEGIDAGIDAYRVKDPNLAQRMLELAPQVAAMGVAGKAVPAAYGLSSGTDIISAGEAAGAPDAAIRGAGAAARDTAIWSAGTNLAVKMLPPHLAWLGNYATAVAKNALAAAGDSMDYQAFGYDVDLSQATGDAAKMAALFPFAVAGVKELSRLSYTAPDGRSYPLGSFAQRFQTRIKQADRTPEDARQIALDYIDMVESAPGRFILPVSPEGKTIQKFSGLLVQRMKGNEKVGRPTLVDPEAQNGAHAEAWANDDIRSWYAMYQQVIGDTGLAELRKLTEKESLTSGEKARMTELITAPAHSDARVTGLAPNGEYVDQSISEMIGSLALQDSEQRAQSLQTLATFLKGAQHYAPEEKALVLSLASQYAVRNGRNGRQLVSIDTTNIQQPTVVGDGQVAAMVDAMRKGVAPKKAMLAEPVKADSTIGKRGVPVDYTGWKRFDKSDDPKDIEALTAACAGSKGGWCTGSGAAGGQLPLGDFHVHFTNGEPDVAIRMEGSRVEEVRGSDTGQRLFPKEAEEAERYIRAQQDSGYQMEIDKGFWADQAFRRKLANETVTWRDVWEIDPEKPSFAGAAGEMGVENSWPPYAKKVIDRVLKESEAERHSQGYFYERDSDRITDTSLVKHFKGRVLHLDGTKEFPNLESVSGSLIIGGDASAPKLSRVDGGLVLERDASAPNISNVSGSLTLHKGASIPNVSSVGGSLTLFEGASAPNVSSIGRSLHLYKGASAPNVSSVGGDLNLYEGASAPNVSSVGGDLNLYEGASAPNVSSVGRDLYLHAGASAPNVSSVGRDLYLHAGASAPNVSSVGGSLTLFGDASAPNVSSVGRNLYLHAGASAPPLLTEIGGDLNLFYDGASAQNISRVGGQLHLSEGSSAPNVSSVGGNLYLHAGASAPNVSSVGGNLSLYGGISMPLLAEVGGNLTLSEGSSTPRLSRVGGYLDLNKGASVPEHLTSVGWLPASFSRELWGESADARVKLRPKYGYLDDIDNVPILINERGELHDRQPGFLTAPESPSYVRDLAPVWHELDPWDQQSIIEDSVNGWKRDSREQERYGGYADSILPFALKAGRTRRNVRTADGGGRTVETFDTPIPKELQAKYDAWYAQLPENLRHTEDYDLQGTWLERLGQPDKYEASQNGHLDDYGKKPNHITFSTGSKWHDPKIPERTGGEWKQADDGSWDFYPGAGNKASDDELKAYFEKYEKGNRVHGREVRQDAGGGDAGSETAVSETPVAEAPVRQDGPRIVINPQVFGDKRDALCVAFNEAFRLVMEENGFEPVSEPTEKQRKFFSDTAYADDELQLRRTILARIATLDTSVSDPTDEQLEETAEMLEMVMEVGAPQNEWEQQAVQRLHDVIVKMRESPRSEPAATPPAPRGEGSATAAMGGGETKNDEVRKRNRDYREALKELMQRQSVVAMSRRDPTPEKLHGTLRASPNVMPRTLATALGAGVDPMEVAKEGYRAVARGEAEDPLLSRGAARAIGAALSAYQGLETAAGVSGFGAPTHPVELVSRRNTATGVPVARRPVDATPEQRQAFDDTITARNKAKRHARSKGSTVDRDAARHAAKLEARKAKPRVYVDPASVPEFSPSGETYAFGIRTYNVENTEAGQLAVRRVIDAQLGKDRNPWCVIEYGPDGKLTAGSKKLWKEYSHVQKQIAFNEDGEVIAFRASPPPVRGMLARRDRSGNWWTLDSNTALEPPEELSVGGDGVPVRLPDPEIPGRTRLVLIGSKEHPLTMFRGDYEVGREDVPFDKPITVQYERGVKRAFEPYELWDRRGQLKYRRTIKDGVAHSEVYTTYRDGRPPELLKTYDLRQATPAEKAALKQYDESWRKANPGRNPDFEFSYYLMKPVFGDASEQDNIQGAYRYGIGGDGYVNVGRSIWYSDGRPVVIQTYFPNGATRFAYEIGSNGKVNSVYSYLPSETRRKGESDMRFHYIRDRETGRLERQEDAKGGDTRQDWGRR